MPLESMSLKTLVLLFVIPVVSGAPRPVRKDSNYRCPAVYRHVSFLHAHK